MISYPGYTTFNAFDANNRIPSFSAACIACHDTRANRGAARAHALANVVNFSYSAPTATTEAVWNVGTVPPSRATASETPPGMVSAVRIVDAGPITVIVNGPRIA